ncbi:DUF302 domain-containing protein [Dyella sp. C9]|uniref:DUF302 domain-containing protein n=1 Tax=Dyella sp. C9 TaxID=2202154 RepID=UPI000DEF019D|nr:DUF302 domain-containing protein [Dyella sp. C9]
MTATSEARGVEMCRSALDVRHTVEKLVQLLDEHGITLFARIDFSGDAGRAGLSMRPEQLLLFGNPKAGTPLMQVEPLTGLDLPLKALVWEDELGTTWVAWNTPDYIVTRHGLPASAGTALAGAFGLIRQVLG